MSAQTQPQDEPSYLGFARANAREALSSSPALVRELLARIDRDAAALKAAQPRIIDNTTDLDKLRFESVILDAYGTPYVCQRHRTDGTFNEWQMSGHSHLMDSVEVLMHGPVTVVHEPKAAA